MRMTSVNSKALFKQHVLSVLNIHKLIKYKTTFIASTPLFLSTPIASFNRPLFLNSLPYLILVSFIIGIIYYYILIYYKYINTIHISRLISLYLNVWECSNVQVHQSLPSEDDQFEKFRDLKTLTQSFFKTVHIKR